MVSYMYRLRCTFQCKVIEIMYYVETLPLFPCLSYVNELHCASKTICVIT